MPLEAQIIEVTKPGEGVNILVAFKDRGVEIGRETLVFGPHEILNEAAVRLRINQIGTRLETALNSETFVKTIVGSTFPVERPPVIPNPNLPLGARV